MPEATELLHSNLQGTWAPTRPRWRGVPGRPAGQSPAGVDILTIRDGRVSVVRTLIAPESDA